MIGKTLTAIIFLAIALISLPSMANLLVSNATVRLLPPGVKNTSAYFSISNQSQQDHYLVAADVDFAEKAELHAHIMQGDMMRMEQQEKVLIPAGETVIFKPGSLHIMIFGLHQSLHQDQTVTLTLITDDQQSVLVEATVVMPGQESVQHRHH